MLPPAILLDPWLKNWLLEDIGRGDITTQGICFGDGIQVRIGQWIAKEAGVIVGLPIASRVFQLLNEQVKFIPMVAEGNKVESGQVIAEIEGAIDALLTGERVALNLAMRLSGIASTTRKYTEIIADLPTKLVDTRKTTPGLRILEKYATKLGGAVNHRLGLDDAVMIKDNHIAAAGGIANAIALVRQTMPYPLSIEVETETLEQVIEAISHDTDIIMLDNMSVPMMTQSVELIRQSEKKIKIEASGNISLETIRKVAETGVDYISTSSTITRAPWLDLSMKFIQTN